MCFRFSDGRVRAAVAWWRVSLRSTASRLSERPVRVGNTGSVGAPGGFGKPAAQCFDRGLGQRRGPVFASLAVAGDVRACAEVDVVAAQANQFGDAQPGLDHEQHEHPIPPPGPGRRIWGLQQGVDLVGTEVGDQRPFETFGRHGQDPADGGGVFGVARGGEAKQRVNRREPGIAGAHAVMSVVFEMVQERRDQFAVDIADVERGWLLACSRGGEAEHQSPGVSIGADGFAAGVALPGQPVGEERLQCGSERGHCPTPRLRSSRSRAAANSCGVSDSYQSVPAGLVWPR